MAYATLSHWITTEWDDALEAIARDKFVPLIMSVGATRVQMIRTGNLSFSVVTEYDDQAAAESAQARITEICAQATDELPMTMGGTAQGRVFAAS